MIDFRQLFHDARSKGSRSALLALVITGLVTSVALVSAASYVSYRLVSGSSDNGSEQPTASRDAASDVTGAGNGRPPHFPRSDYRQSRFPKGTTGPLIGMNYTNYAFPHCDPSDTGILKTFSEPGVATSVHRQLFTMRRKGITSLRTIIWNITDASQHTAGTTPLISSGGGHLQRADRTNMARYFAEVKRFGFRRLTVSFSPQGTNNPIISRYDPGKFVENWYFIKTVRSLLKRYGPSDSRIDLLNEGAPSNYLPKRLMRQLKSYLGRMYGLYTRAYGARDVSISLVAPRAPADMGNRLQNLINILKERRLPQPRWYDIHIGYTPAEALYGLSNSDSVLKSNHQPQPLVIGETAYNNGAIAKNVQTFVRSNPRPIDEVSPWYLLRETGCRVSPPYDPGAYRAELSSAAFAR